MTILATGLEEELHTQESKVLGDDDYFEQLIPKLYRPVKKAARQITTNKEEEPTKETVSPTEVEVQVEVAEPKEISEPAPSDNESPKKENPTMVERWKSWMINKFEEYTQES